MSELKIACPRCGGHLSFPEEIAGQTASCPHCGQAVVLEPLPGTTICKSQPTTHTCQDGPAESGGKEKTKLPQGKPRSTMWRGTSLVGKRPWLSWTIRLCLLPIVGYLLLWLWGVRSFERFLGPDPKEETELQTRERWKQEADAALRTECTNAFVGLSRIIKTELHTQERIPEKWTAEVTAEFVNRVGGIERTNLPFMFYTWGDWSSANHPRRVHCLVDGRELMRRESAARDREFERLRRGQH